MSASQNADPILAQASEWLLRLQAAPEDLALRAAVETWLAQDPAHAAAWARTQRAWAAIGEAKADARPRRTAIFRSRPERRPFRAVAGAALAALLALVVVLPSARLALEADHRTEIAETRSIELEDGSIVHLSADSAIREDYTSTRRAVTLLAGEAFFDVTQDPSRPFTVEADGLEVAVLGTSFNVRIGARSHAVDVATGSVSVRHRGPDGSVAHDLSPGDRLSVDRVSGNDSLTKGAPADSALWREGTLFVENVTVYEVAAELKRWSGTFIVIPDRNLGERRVTGRFDLRAPDRALEALVAPFSGRVWDEIPYLRVLTPG